MISTLLQVTPYLNPIGEHIIEKKFTTRAEIQDIKWEGVKFFIFCQGAMSAIEGYLNTASQYMGGFGSNKFVPVFGSKPTNYQTEANV